MTIGDLIKELQQFYPNGEVLNKDYEPIEIDVLTRSLITIG